MATTSMKSVQGPADRLAREDRVFFGRRARGVEEDLHRPRLHARKHERRGIGHRVRAREAEHVAVERKTPLDVGDDQVGSEFLEREWHRRIVFFAAYAIDPARDATLEHAQEEPTSAHVVRAAGVARRSGVSGDTPPDS